MFDLYSMEADNDDIDIDFKETTNDETAVDDAGSDSVTTDVSNISGEKTNHNEEASAGGVATGSNEDDIAVDPVVATESFVYHRFGLSREDVDEAIEQCKMALLRKSKNVLDANFIEGMACINGCIGGAGCLTHGEKNKAEVDKYGREALEKNIGDAISVLK